LSNIHLGDAFNLLLKLLKYLLGFIKDGKLFQMWTILKENDLCPVLVLHNGICNFSPTYAAPRTKFVT
jgi:hypothetical protein